MKAHRIAAFCTVATLAFGTVSGVHGNPNLKSWTSPEGLTRLYESGDADQLLLGALMTAKHISSPHSVGDFYRKVLSKDPSNGLTLYSFMVYCLYGARTDIWVLG